MTLNDWNMDGIKKKGSKNVQVADDLSVFVRARAFPPIAIPFDA